MSRPTPDLLHRLQHEQHPFCMACGHVNPHGLQLAFEICPDGGVQGVFCGSKFYEGYPGVLHGGVVSSLLDAAMANCLFAHGIVALTAELLVRFSHPVATERPAIIRAWLVDSKPPLHQLKAEIRQDELLCAKATAKFLKTKTARMVSAPRNPTRSEL